MNQNSAVLPVERDTRFVGGSGCQFSWISASLIYSMHLPEITVEADECNLYGMGRADQKQQAEIRNEYFAHFLIRLLLVHVDDAPFQGRTGCLGIGDLNEEGVRPVIANHYGVSGAVQGIQSVPCDLVVPGLPDFIG